MFVSGSALVYLRDDLCESRTVLRHRFGRIDRKVFEFAILGFFMPFESYERGVLVRDRRVDRGMEQAESNQV